MNLDIGLEQKCKQVVSKKDTAKEYGSGELSVFATPAMITLMEKTCMVSVKKYLPKGQTTVGTAVNIKHARATSLGEEVYCISKLIDVERNKLVFSVSAFDSKGEIGRGRHERFVVDIDGFMSKTSI